MNEQRPTSNSHSICDELLELVPVYGMGLADEQEIAKIEANIDQCPDVQAELAEYRDLQGALLLSVPQLTAPPAIREKLLGAINPAPTAPEIEDDPAVTPKAPINFPEKPKAMPRRNPLVAWGLVASVALLLLSNLYWLQQTNTLESDLREIRYENKELLKQIDNAPQLLRSLGTGHAERVELNSDATASDGDAALVWVPGATDDTWVGWFVSRNLPPLEYENTVYQGWLIRDGDEPLSIGVFTVDDASNGAFVFEIAEPIGNFDYVGITVEPSGGSAGPTTDPVALGEI